MSKELFIQAHEELVSEYMDEHPDATWGDAYKKTSDLAYDRMCGNLSDMIDAARVRAKYEVLG